MLNADYNVDNICCEWRLYLLFSLMFWISKKNARTLIYLNPKIEKYVLEHCNQLDKTTPVERRDVHRGCIYDAGKQINANNKINYRLPYFNGSLN